MICIAAVAWLTGASATCSWSGITAPERASHAPTGYDFAAYFQRGLSLIEPSLPRLQRADTKRFADAPSNELKQAALFVAERKLISSNFSETVLSPEAWRRAVTELYS